MIKKVNKLIKAKQLLSKSNKLDNPNFVAFDFKTLNSKATLNFAEHS